MALFFDAAWFDGKPKERDLSRAALARVAGLTPDELVLVFKDQREVSAGQVSAFAELLGVPAAEVAGRSGAGASRLESGGERASRRTALTPPGPPVLRAACPSHPPLFPVGQADGSAGGPPFPRGGKGNANNFDKSWLEDRKGYARTSGVARLKGDDD